MKGIEHYFLIAWPVALPIITFFLGGVYERWTHRETYCERCKLHRSWIDDQKIEAKRIGLAKRKSEAEK